MHIEKDYAVYRSVSHPLYTRQKKVTGLWLALIAFIISAALLGALLVDSRDLSISSGLLLSFIIPIGGVLWQALRSERLNLYDPLYGFLAVFLFSYPLRALYGYIFRSPDASLPLRFYYDSYSEITDIALLMASAGAAAFIAGYHTPFSKNIPAKWTQQTETSIVHATAKLWLIFGIGLLFAMVKYRSGNFSVFIRTDSNVDTSISYIIELLSRLALYSPILAAAIITKKNSERIWLWLTLISTSVFCIAFSLLGGAKLPLLFLAVGISYPFYVSSRRKMRNAMVIGVLLLVLLLFPFMGGFRAYYIETIGYTTSVRVTDGLSLIENLPRLLTIVSEQSLSKTIMNRAVALDSLMLAIKYTPAVHEFQYGRDLVVVPLTSLIPRAIWPNKPMASLTAEDFTVKYVGSTKSAYNQYWAGGTAITPMADLYINLHVFGVVIGMYLIGAVICVIKYASEDLASPISILTFVIAYISVINFDPPLSGIISEWLKLMLVLWAIKLILAWK